MFDYDIAQFIIENGSQLKTDLEPLAIKFYQLRELYADESVMDEIFMTNYKDFFCMLLVEKLSSAFNLTYEELRSMVTPELVEELNGEDYFEYD